MVNVVNASWKKVGDKLGIKVKLDTDEWRTIRPSIRPYFFVREKDYFGNLYDVLKNYDVEKGDYVNTSGESCVKVEVDFPYEVRDLREKIKALDFPCYEADIPFIKRWMIDKDIKISKNPKVLYFDIETDSRKGIWTKESGEDPDQRILSIGAIDENGKEFFICEDDEYEIYKQFNKLLQQYDLLVGYNNLRWDNPFLEARAKVLGIKYDPKQTQWLDMMLLYNKAWGGGYVSLKLDKVAGKELGLHKKMDLYKYKGAEGIWKMFKENREDLREYNVWDSVLLKKLNEKLGCLDIGVELSHISYCMYGDCLFNSRIIDGLLLRKSILRTPRIVFQNKYGQAYLYGTYVRGEEKKNQQEHFKGAYVLTPIRGLHHNVLNFDFTSLYPRIIRTFNIGIETFDDNGEILTGNKRFKIEPRSIFAEFIEELDNLKTTPQDSPEFKIYNIKQYELKILLNAVYGVIGAYGFRFYHKDVAESVTTTGRELLKMMNRILEEMGFKVLYSDTDGTFVSSEKNNDIETILEKQDSVLWLLNDELKTRVMEKYNVPEKYYCLDIKIDDIYSKIYFQGVKKRYAGEKYVLHDDFLLDDWRSRSQTLKRMPIKRNIVGFDIVRLDIPPVVKKVQEKIFDIIFTSETQKEIKTKTIHMLRNVRKLLYDGELDKELIIEKGTRRKLDKYKVETVHVKIAKELFKKGMFRPGDSILYVIVDMDKGKQVGKPVLEGEPFPRIRKKGYDYYKNLIVSMAERILGEKINIENAMLEEFI